MEAKDDPQIGRRVRLLYCGDVYTCSLTTPERRSGLVPGVDHWEEMA